MSGKEFGLALRIAQKGLYKDKTGIKDEFNKESALRIKRPEQRDKLTGGVGRSKGAIRNWQRITLGQIEKKLKKGNFARSCLFFMFRDNGLAKWRFPLHPEPCSLKILVIQ